jgi:hypothetical protein
MHERRCGQPVDHRLIDWPKPIRITRPRRPSAATRRRLIRAHTPAKRHLRFSRIATVDTKSYGLCHASLRNGYRLRLAPGLLEAKAGSAHVTNEPTAATTLRYLDAGHVSHPSGTLAGVTVWSQGDEKLGAIAGVLVEPATRRVEYFVVERRSALLSRQYLLPADTLPVLSAGERKVVVAARPDDLQRFDRKLVEQFSDEDAITAMFARPAA